jgi:hypothetical protein
MDDYDGIKKISGLKYGAYEIFNIFYSLILMKIKI